MSPRDRSEPSEAWFTPTATELDLITEWLAAWNERTGDTASAGPNLRVRARNPDMRYPNFFAMPVVRHASV